ncbi:hypothetical protein ACWGJT_30155, partial [Streptomyces xantholiticus]
TAARHRDLLRDHAPDEEQEEPDPYPGDLDEARRSAAEAPPTRRGRPPPPGPSWEPMRGLQAQAAFWTVHTWAAAPAAFCNSISHDP